MQSRQKSLVWLATTVLVALTGQSGFAFQIKGIQESSSVTTELINPSTNLVGGTSTVTTKQISEIELGGTDDFFNILRQTYGGWTFNKGGNLKGSFNIINYYPCGPLTSCGSELSIFPELLIPSSGKQGGIGASISVDYEPDPDDEPKFGKTYWIQRANVDTGGQNVSIYNQQGTYFNIIDTPSTSNPFYQAADYLGRTNPETRLPSYSFLDSPYNSVQAPKPSYQYNNNWNFELYLAYQKPNQEVTIYNGISWGWTNTFTTTTGDNGCSGGSGGGGCPVIASANKATSKVTLGLPISDIDSSDASQSPTSVPEHTSALGLLALSVWGVFQGLKIRKDK